MRLGLGQLCKCPYCTLETAFCKPHNVVWPNQFKLNRFETDLSASVNGL